MKTIPKHLQTSEQLTKSVQQSKNKEGAFKLANGHLLTPMMKEYCEELVFGGVYRKPKEWAEFCGVTLYQIQRWNQHPAIVEYISQLKELRRQQLEENFQTTLGATLNKLNSLLQMDATYTVKKGKKEFKRINVDLVEQQRELVLGYLNYQKGDNQKLVAHINNNINNNQQQVNKPFEIELETRTKEEIDKELREFKAIESMQDDK